MTATDDMDLLAAEYVLGTLDPAERAAVAARLGREPHLRAAVEAWEQRLCPLDEGTSEITPSPELLAEIEARIAARRGVPSPTGPSSLISPQVFDLRRRVGRWRAAAIAASAIAASLLLSIGVREASRPNTASGTLVAVLQKDAASPAFLLTVDVDKRVMTVRPVAAKQQPGKSYELWIVHDSLKAPRSLGVVADEPFTVRPTLAAYKPDVVEQATFAVTLEPEGGSPSGAPTGPILFAGKLIQATK